MPPLDIKLGLFYQFVKALISLATKEFPGDTFPGDTFPLMTEAKLKKSIFVGPQFRELIKKSDTFMETLNPAEL